jgi:predicted acyl esterase
MRSKLFLIAILIVLPGQIWAQANQRTYEVTVKRAATATMRDGVVLNADIYCPQADGKFPVLLKRTPYDKNEDFWFGMKAAAKGYVVIIQDVRGRYTSAGEWYPFQYESNDGMGCCAAVF